MKGAYEITPFYATDERGGFIKDYNIDAFKQNGIDHELKEVFYTISKKGVIRAMHFQLVKQQAKLVRCISGHVYDVIIDLRPDSPTFGKWQGFDLTGENQKALYIPQYFGHGYLVLEDSVVSYKCGEVFYGDWQKAKDAAKAIIDLKQYELDPDYTNLFKVSGVDSKEIILADQNIETLDGLGTIGQMYNNVDQGWSSIVPTQNLVDMYEMSDGLTKEESKTYDAKHPFANRDPRMAMTILYPGRDWRGDILNTLDEKFQDGTVNKNFPTYTDNASKSALTWAKYLDPMDQYGDVWSSGACPIVFRYAEVLLTYAEAANELSGPSDEIYGYLNQIRQRVGMREVDKAKYGTKEKLRELIRRERTVELAGEGLRRADIVRWQEDGKMLAEKVLNGDLLRVTGTINYGESEPTKRAEITGTAVIETRQFSSRNRYLPIPQTSMDKNPNLKQNPGY